MARFIEDKLKQFCENLKEQSVRVRTQLEKLEYQLSDGYKKNNIPPADGWLPMTPQVELVGYDAHFWIKGNFETPQVGEHEYLVPYEACLTMEKTSEAYIAMMSVLERTANIVDMRDIYSESPEFKFMLSQPEIYQYLKEEAPEICTGSVPKLPVFT